MGRDLDPLAEAERPGTSEELGTADRLGAPERPGRFDPRSQAPADRSFLGLAASLRGEHRRIIVCDGERIYRFRQSETVLLKHVGAFRSVRRSDLERFAYAGRAIICDADRRRLRRHGLLTEQPRIDPASGRLDPVVTLTDAGASVARLSINDPRQAVYSDLARPHEVAHDANVYRMYHAQAARIGHAGGRVQRVVLDYELNRAFHRMVHNESVPLEEAARRQHLVVVSGRVQIPDLRIEYEARSGDLARVDLELATDTYSASQLRAKARAGFTIYAPASDVERQRSIIEELAPLVEIYSL